MSKPLLTLETLAPDDRPTVTIDDVEYDLALPEDFGLREEAENGRLVRKAAEILKSIEATEDVQLEQAMVAELEQLLSGFLEVILRAPADVRGRLGFRQQLAIVEAFTQVVTSRAARSPRSPGRRSTSASSPRACRRRTARATGSRSRSASSPRSS